MVPKACAIVVGYRDGNGWVWVGCSKITPTPVKEIHTRTHHANGWIFTPTPTPAGHPAGAGRPLGLATGGGAGSRRQWGLATGSGARSQLRRGMATNGRLRRAGERPTGGRPETELATEIWLAAGGGIGGGRRIRGWGGGLGPGGLLSWTPGWWPPALPLGDGVTGRGVGALGVWGAGAK
jgi:hypothetical protein